METVFLRQRTTSCGTLRSASITPHHRYDHCSLYRVPSPRWCHLILLLLRCSTILRYYPTRSGSVSRRTLGSSDSPGCFTSSSFSSMQSETPGARDSSRHDDLPRIACAQNERIGISPTYKTFGAMCPIQCSTHFTSLNSSWSMRLLASQVLPSDLAKPCSGRPPCLLGSDSLPGYPLILHSKFYHP